MITKDLSLVNWPNQSGEYKVVQFDNGDEVYLRFGNDPEHPLGYGDFHEFILERFAKEIDVECLEIQVRGDDISILPDDISYKLVGAGRCNLDVTAKSAAFFGSSRDYSKDISSDHIAKLALKFPDWQIK